MQSHLSRRTCVCECRLGGAGRTSFKSRRINPSSRHHQSTKASSTSTPSSSSSASSATTAEKSVPGTWPNSFEPLVLDSRYIGHYRDPLKHDASSSSAFTLPISKRARAAWFAPSTVNPVVSNVHATPLHHSQMPGAPPEPSLDINHRTSKARSARREMEKAWGASSSLLNGHSTPTEKTSGGSSKTKTTPPLTALLMPGSGSQYVGMASFLDNFKAARETWEEAEEVGQMISKQRTGPTLTDHLY